MAYSSDVTANDLVLYSQFCNLRKDATHATLSHGHTGAANDAKILSGSVIGSVSGGTLTPSNIKFPTNQSAYSLSFGTVYQNTTGYPLVLNTVFQLYGTTSLDMRVDSVSPPSTIMARVSLYSGGTNDFTTTCIVGPNLYYQGTVTSGSAAVISSVKITLGSP